MGIGIFIGTTIFWLFVLVAVLVIRKAKKTKENNDFIYDASMRAKKFRNKIS